MKQCRKGNDANREKMKLHLSLIQTLHPSVFNVLMSRHSANIEINPNSLLYKKLQLVIFLLRDKIIITLRENDETKSLKGPCL